MENRKRLIFIFIVIVSSIFVDQVSKYIVSQTIKFSPPKEYLGGFFVLKYAENTGAMLGFGSDLPESVRFWFLTVFVGVMLIVLLSYLILNRDFTKAQSLGLALIASGGISNFVDRAINNGRVVDFMHMDSGYGWVKTGIFNFADVSIMVGLGIMILWGDWREKHSAKEESDIDNEPNLIGNSQSDNPYEMPEDKLPQKDS
ncbi:MAG: signal peptidase II [Calditrichaeota bacterium]|nr:signal peptidase II [Calditrichota bacterium]